MSKGPAFSARSSRRSLSSMEGEPLNWIHFSLADFLGRKGRSTVYYTYGILYISMSVLVSTVFCRSSLGPFDRVGSPMLGSPAWLRDKKLWWCGVGGEGGVGKTGRKTTHTKQVFHIGSSRWSQNLKVVEMPPAWCVSSQEKSARLRHLTNGSHGANWEIGWKPARQV